jgi:hypothetical protein
MSAEMNFDQILNCLPWRCYHCDFVTRDAAEAEAHFGERDDAEEFKPICKWWSRMDDHERLETMQSYIKDLAVERNENYSQRIAIEGLEYQVGLLYNKDFSGYKPFRDAKVTSVYEAFCLYDSMEGRALSAEEKLKALEAVHE